MLFLRFVLCGFLMFSGLACSEMFNHQIGVGGSGDGDDPGDGPGDGTPIIDGGYKLQGATVDFSGRLFLIEQGQTEATGYKGVFSTSFNSETLIEGPDPIGAPGDNYILYSKGFSLDHIYTE